MPRLATLKEETTELDITVELLLLTVRAELEKSAFEIVDADISSEGLLKLEIMKGVKSINTKNSFKKDLIGLVRFNKTQMRMKFKENRINFGKLTNT